MRTRGGAIICSDCRVPGGRFRTQLQLFLYCSAEATETWCPSSNPLLHNYGHPARLKAPLGRALFPTGQPLAASKIQGIWVPRTLAVGPRKLKLASAGPTLNDILAMLTSQDCCDDCMGPCLVQAVPEHRRHWTTAANDLVLFPTPGWLLQLNPWRADS